jgi:hypothetical protein
VEKKVVYGVGLNVVMSTVNSQYEAQKFDINTVLNPTPRANSIIGDSIHREVSSPVNFFNNKSQVQSQSMCISINSMKPRHVTRNSMVIVSPKQLDRSMKNPPSQNMKDEV